jgi:hypothetical protein
LDAGDHRPSSLAAATPSEEGGDGDCNERLSSPQPSPHRVRPLLPFIVPSCPNSPGLPALLTIALPRRRTIHLRLSPTVLTLSVPRHIDGYRAGPVRRLISRPTRLERWPSTGRWDSRCVPIFPGPTGYRWIEVYPSGTSTGLALIPPGPDPVGVRTGIILNTKDIDATYAQMEALGVDIDAGIARVGSSVQARLGAVEQKEPQPPMFWFRDPDGNQLLVVQPHLT